MAWMDTATSTLSLLQGLLHAAFSALVRLVVSLARIAALPFATVWRALVLAVAPITYTLRFLLLPLFVTWNHVPRLEPLYIYFGSAAFVGVIFGLLFVLGYSAVSAVFGLYDDSPADHEREEPGRWIKPHTKSADDPYPLIGHEHDSIYRQQPQPTTPRLDTSEYESYEALLSNLISPDSDLGGLAMHGWRDSPNTKRKRKSAATSRIGTILEEDDDSL